MVTFWTTRVTPLEWLQVDCGLLEEELCNNDCTCFPLPVANSDVDVVASGTDISHKKGLMEVPLGG